MSNDYDELNGLEYEALYARYLKDPGRLLCVSGVPLNEKTRMLDLCSGSGLVVRAAIKLGLKPANIVAVEGSEKMPVLLRAKGINVLTENVSWERTYDGTRLGKLGPFDLITCRQAVNYWWSPEGAAAVCRLLAPGGVFVFNTFNSAPSQVPRVLQYKHHDGASFAEVSWLDGGTVRHVQVRSGMPPHVTSFRWIPPEEFLHDLGALTEPSGVLASISVEYQGKTDTYICRR